MPQLGESVHEGTISKWLVKLGDKVVEFEPMLEVDTDKVSAEVPAPVTGILREILAKEGETVQAGAEIAVVEVGGDDGADAANEASTGRSSPPAGEVPPGARSDPRGGGDVQTRTIESGASKAETPPAAPPAPAAPAPAAPKPKAAPSSPPAGEVPPGARSAPRGGGDVQTRTIESGASKAETPRVAPEPAPAAAAPASSSPPAGEVPPGARSAPRGGGDVETGRTETGRIESGATEAETPPVAPEPPPEAIPTERPLPLEAREASLEGPPHEVGRQAHRFSPAVQMVASELKVDLTKVTGTGLGGRVTKKDVQDFAASPKAARAATAVPSVAPGEGDQVVQLTRVRRLIAENMTRSKATIPHAWQTQEADMSGVVANRAANKVAFQKQEGFSLTYLPYVMAATTSALREHPQLNSTFNETELIVHRDINLGVTVGLEDTLVVPVVRRADGLSIAGLARAVNDVATRARNKQLKADDLSGGTFTVNNSGTFGTLFSYSVINPGQAGILTMEAIVDRPVAVNGMIGIKPMMYLCFSFDHRVLDGLQAARFLTSCRKWLEAVTLESPVY